MLAKVLNSVTGKIRTMLYALGFFTRVLFETFFFIRRKKTSTKVLMWQILFTGFEALSVVTLISLSIGAVIIIQGNNILPLFGQGALVYTILITIITRELGPLLTAFIIIARSGTAIASELGQMVVSHQVEAYVSVGIDPVAYLIVPRFLGVTLSLLILNIYFNFIGLFGSFFVAQMFKRILFEDYFLNLLQTIQLGDILSSMIKSFVFGIIISTVATYQGLNVRVASTEIPRTVIKAVGQSFVLCLVADVVIIMLFSYLYRG